MIDLINKHFNLTPDNLPDWLDSVVENDCAVIRSYAWTSDRCRRIRLCDLEIKDKFTAVPLVIYPEFKYETPSFGKEYLRIGGKKFFGATDFHPVKSGDEYEQKYILNYLGDMPDRDKDNSKFYDLSKFFSRKFWLKKDTTDFWDEYITTTDLFLSRYKSCLFESEPIDSSMGFHIDYDSHMSANDPAHGILKSYYSQEFADNYIKDFLFNENHTND